MLKLLQMDVCEGWDMDRGDQQINKLKGRWT